MSFRILKIDSTRLCEEINTSATAAERRNELHISRKARDKYHFDQLIFASNGNVIFANFHAVREFSKRMNDKKDLINFPEQAVKAGQINAMGLIDEILHYVVALYRRKIDPKIFTKALQFLEARLGKDHLDKSLMAFTDQFPPVDVYKRIQEPAEYLSAETEGESNSQIALEEMLLLYLANENPAFSPYLELFDDVELEKFTAYHQIIAELNLFFAKQPEFGPDKQNLIAMLKSPAQAEPHSLSGQLKFVLDHWGILLGKYLYRLLGGLDFIKEEEKMRFAFGPGVNRVSDFHGLEEEPERFSPDKDWMPRLVLIAKSALVWLDQLSKKYQRAISRLDQIPDEELDRLAAWGFTGLWLIGVWQRSSASKKIKQYCGNPEAESSAYSLYDYVIADELGGEAALQNLKERCWQRGIRLASDMVPNHTGIYSRWVIEHPDWFIGQEYCPFPSYRFNGANLSENPGVGVFIDDHYYERTDAAVVFKRIDFNSGEVRFIYHGNDGTSMPWNDTAQLNYLKPEVREAVIQTILDVARMFPIIRFDAAMTLAKKHFQRLWFPEPGTGGDIPSRSEHSMTREQFDALFPVEFWREVVDRVALEVPDTLLLAEAFWLMEGYFVRTLGMHRVYNSAFMNMLKNEENEKYRSVIKKTIEFNPEILRRYVNFMNNPDEETAVAQFGKGDKYIGTAIMMVTMPGLPMFGHGQVEGFTEKYGMEYRRAYWDEQPDWDLIQRHERYIFPLMKKRYLFADVQNFLLYDFFTPEGHVNENVFAYSNRQGNEKTLVIYNNKYENTAGWIKTSAAFAQKTGLGSEQRLVQKSLGEGLSLQNDENYFTIFKDHISGFQYIRRNKELWENGLYIELGAFQYHVFWEFREVMDNEWHHYAQLNSYLEGKGVSDIETALKELFLRPVHRKFAALFNAGHLETLIHLIENEGSDHEKIKFVDRMAESYSEFLDEIIRFTQAEPDLNAITAEFKNSLKTLLSFAGLREKYLGANKFAALSSILEQMMEKSEFYYPILFGWIGIHKIGKIAQEECFEGQSRSWIDEWMLGKIVTAELQKFGLDEQQSIAADGIIKILTARQNWCSVSESPGLQPFEIMNHLLQDQEVQQFLQVNRYQDILWYNQESFESLMGWLASISLISCAVDLKQSEVFNKTAVILSSFLEAQKDSGFKVEKLLGQIRKTGTSELG